jgi:uncharacterized protein (DUF2336 family)
MATVAKQYQELGGVLQSDDSAARKALAADPATPPEVLYFLAEKGEIEIRRLVAENPSTPNQADVMLSRDDDVSVRCALARKIVGEGLDDDAKRNLWRMGFTILETLLRDQVVSVRRILSEAFSSPSDAPRAIVMGLARDANQEIATPVLSGSPVLTEEDLTALIEDGAPDWAKCAIAERETVSPHLCDILISDDCPVAMTRLAENNSIALSEPVLEKIVHKAETVPEIQPALVERRDLSDNLLVRLVRFVAAPLLSKLCNCREIDSKVAARMNRAIETRSDHPSARVVAKPQKAKTEAALKKKSAVTTADGDAPRYRAKRLFDENALTDDTVAGALDNKDYEFVVAALALRASIPMPTVERMIRVKSVKTIVALAWKAGFSARFSMDLQRDLAFIPPKKIMNARDGLDFPMRTDDMESQLSIFE